MRGLVSDSASIIAAKLKHDVLAGPVDGNDLALMESFGLSGGWCFEGLGMGTEPDFDDAVAADARVDAAGDCFNLGQFRHRLILEGRACLHLCTPPDTADSALMRFSRLADPTGFKAYDAPYAARIFYIDPRVPVAPGDIAVRTCRADLGPRSDQRGRSIHANLSVGELDGLEVHGAGAKDGEGLLFGLQDAGGSDGDVIVGEQGIHGRDVVFQHSIAPGVFEAFDLVPRFVLFCARHGRQPVCRKQQHEEGKAHRKTPVPVHFRTWLPHSHKRNGW